jgi:hypothetical protein
MVKPGVRAGRVWLLSATAFRMRQVSHRDISGQAPVRGFACVAW